MTITRAQFLDTAHAIASLLGAGFTVDQPHANSNVIDVRVDPSTAIGDHTKFDFIRVWFDDATYRVLHMTHSEVLCGEAALTGSMRAHVARIVLDFCEIAF
jgi:hypothetical protein